MFRLTYPFAFLAIWTRVVQTQSTSAECTGDYTWAYNSKSKSPCEVATELMEICRGSGYTVYPLPSGASYWGPRKGFDTLCVCSTVTWGLFSACGICQNKTAISWSTWTHNCSNVIYNSFPLNVSQHVVIPHWANLNVGYDDRWNETAARADTQNSNHHSSAGAIVGGVVGGLAGLSISIVLGVFLRRRRRRRRAMRRSSSAREEGASPHQPGDTTATPDPTPNQPSCQRLYNPSDPTTFPSPIDYDELNAAYTNPPGSPGGRPTIIY